MSNLKSYILQWISEELLAALYQQLPSECYESLKAVEPLREIPKDRPTQDTFYKTLEEFKKK